MCCRWKVRAYENSNEPGKPAKLQLEGMILDVNQTMESLPLVTKKALRRGGASTMLL